MTEMSEFAKMEQMNRGVLFQNSAPVHSENPLEATLLFNHVLICFVSDHLLHGIQMYLSRSSVGTQDDDLDWHNIWFGRNLGFLFSSYFMLADYA